MSEVESQVVEPTVIETSVEESPVIETEAPAETEGTESPAEPKKKGDVPKGVAKRFHELTQQRKQEEARALRAEQELAALQERLQKAEPQKQDKAAPNPADFPAGEYDPRYQAALIRHEVAQAREEMLNQFKDLEQHKAREVQKVRLEQLDAKAAREIPDYAEARDLLLADPVLAQNETIGAAVLNQDDPTQLIHYLGTHPDEAYALTELDPIKAMFKLGGILERLNSNKGTAAAPVVSKAPTPAPKVGVGGTPPPMSSAQATSMAEYVRLRNAELKAG